MAKANELDRRILDGMSGKAKVEALLMDAGFPTMRSVAMEIKEPESDVSRAMNGAQERPETLRRIRGKIAKLAGLDRATVDTLLDQGA